MDQQPTTQEKNEELYVHCVFCEEYIKDIKELEEHYKKHKEKGDIKCSLIIV